RPRRRDDDQRPPGRLALVLQRMHRAAWDVDEVPRVAMDGLPARPERDVALQQVEGLILEMVDVRRRASARREQTLDDETASVRVRTCGQKAHPVARPAIHRAGSCWHILDLILICHGSDSFLLLFPVFCVFWRIRLHLAKRKKSRFLSRELQYFN